MDSETHCQRLQRVFVNLQNAWPQVALVLLELDCIQHRRSSSTAACQEEVYMLLLGQGQSVAHCLSAVNRTAKFQVSACLSVCLSVCLAVLSQKKNKTASVPLCVLLPTQSK